MTGDPKTQASELFQRAYELQMEGKLSEAISCYKKSIALCPTAEAHTFLGWTYSMQGRLPEAVEECHRAIGVDPDFGNPYNDIGAYLIEMNKLDEAIPWLEKAIKAKRYECYFYPHLNLGRVLELKGKWHQALEEYKSAFNLKPDYTLAYHAYLRLQARMN